MLCYAFWYGRGWGGEDTGENTSYYLYINDWYRTISPTYIRDGHADVIDIYITAFLGNRINTLEGGVLYYSIFTN